MGKLVDIKVTGFNATCEDDGKIILEPTVDIPARELWLYENRAALSRVRQGLREAKAGKTSKLDISTLANEE